MSKVVYAARANALLGPSGAVVSLLSMIVVVRSLKPSLYAEYGTVLAFIGWLLLFSEAGGNIGFIRYLKDAEQSQSRGTLYLNIMRRRWLTGLAVIVLLQLAGPLWVRWSGLSPVIWNPIIFLAISLIVFSNLGGQLSYYGLLGTFRHAEAMTISQVFTIMRSLFIAITAVVSQSLIVLVYVLVAIYIIEGLFYHFKIWKIFKTEQMPLSDKIINASQRHGLVTVFDKLTSAIGDGPFLLLVLAPFYGRPELAILSVATDTVKKALYITGLPMSYMVLPYLNNARDDNKNFAIAVRKVIKLSILLFLPLYGALFVFAPSGVPMLFGTPYADAATLLLLISFPVFFDAWVRFVLTSALITNGRYRQVIALNTMQAVLVLVALMVTYQYGLTVIIAAQGLVKIFISIGVIWLAYREEIFSIDLIPNGLLRATSMAVLFGIGTWLLTNHYGHWSVFFHVAIYLLTLLFGLRLWFRGDNELYELLYKLSGRMSSLIKFVIPVKC